MKDRKSYKQLLLIYLGAVVGIFAIAAAAMEFQNEKNYKKLILQTRLEGYADRIEAYGPDKVHFDEEVRMTIIDSLGTVVYDSHEPSLCEDHSTRPEILACTAEQTGWAIRYSETQHCEFCYLAKRYGDHIIRVAIPHELDLKRFLRPNMTFILIAVLLLILVLFLLGQAMLRNYRKLEEALDEVEAEKATNKRIKREMTHNIAHELRTPVSSMRGYLEMLTDCDDLPEDRRKLFIQRAYIQSLRLSELLRDIGLVTKMEEAPEMIKKSEILPAEIFDCVCDELSGILASQKIRVENKLAQGMSIEANTSLVYAIFRNLVENSCKYAGEGITIHIEANMREDMVEFLYYDTGCGLPESMLDKIFERFFRYTGHVNASSSSSDSSMGGKRGSLDRDAGSGLGLSVVRNAVRFHGGEIKARPHKPHGLEFIFTMQQTICS